MAELLQAIDESFDNVALEVESAVKRTASAFIAFARNGDANVLPATGGLDLAGAGAIVAHIAMEPPARPARGGGIAPDGTSPAVYPTKI